MAISEAQKRATMRWREKNMDKVLANNRRSQKRRRRARYEGVVNDILAIGNDKEKLLDYVSEHLQVKGGRRWNK